MMSYKMNILNFRNFVQRNTSHNTCFFETPDQRNFSSGKMFVLFYGRCNFFHDVFIIFFFRSNKLSVTLGTLIQAEQRLMCTFIVHSSIWKWKSNLKKRRENNSEGLFTSKIMSLYMYMFIYINTHFYSKQPDIKRLLFVF